MAKCSVNFEVITRCSIELDIFHDDYTGNVVKDIEDILEDFKPQIIDMIQKKRCPEFITKHGHRVKLKNHHNVRLSDSSYDEIDEFIANMS